MLLNWIKLSLAPNVGPARAQLLLNHFGSIESIFDTARSKELAKLLPKRVFVDIIDPNLSRKAVEILSWCEEHDVQVLIKGDERYPCALAELFDAPLLLYALGDIPVLNAPSVGVVGMRNPDTYGEEMTRMLASDLVHCGQGIVSGLAYGVDRIAHETALDNNGFTVAVMATGLDTVYPAAHRDLAKRIIGNGALITEFAPGVRGEPYRFIQRNRIISGISQATVVVQAAQKSGSLATARFAMEQGRDLFAVPGLVTNEKSFGANNLLAQGAAPALSGNQILGYMRGSTTVEQMEIPIRQQKRIANPKVKLSEEESKLFDIFPAKGIVSMEQLLDASDMDMGEIIEMLFDLEMRGVVKMGAGNCYERAV